MRINNFFRRKRAAKKPADYNPVGEGTVLSPGYAADGRTRQNELEAPDERDSVGLAQHHCAVLAGGANNRSARPRHMPLHEAFRDRDDDDALAAKREILPLPADEASHCTVDATAPRILRNSDTSTGSRHPFRASPRSSSAARTDVSARLYGRREVSAS